MKSSLPSKPKTKPLHARLVLSDEGGLGSLAAEPALMGNASMDAFCHLTGAMGLSSDITDMACSDSGMLTVVVTPNALVEANEILFGVSDQELLDMPLGDSDPWIHAQDLSFILGSLFSEFPNDSAVVLTWG